MSIMLPEEKSQTSKHLKGTAELLLVIPIKPGFVRRSETVSYASRLRNLLGIFFEFRKKTADITRNDTPLPIDLLETIYAAQWTVLEPENQLLVAVTFDRTWEEYFANLQGVTGQLLDALFIHCIGYERHTSRDGFDSFTQWVRSHQRPTNFVFHFDPELTSTDLRSLRKLACQLGKATAFEGDPPELIQYAENHAINSVIKETVDGVPDNDSLRDALRSLYEFRRYFPVDEQIQLRNGPPRTASEIYDAAVASLLAPIFQLALLPPDPNVHEACRHLSPQATAWVEDIKELIRVTHIQDEAAKVAPPTWEQVQPGQVQANILRPVPQVLSGFVVLLQADNARATRALLRDQDGRVTWEDGKPYTNEPVVYCNLALTYGGLVRLQLSDATLKHFPKEFREGMEQRSGLLGDLGAPNHPHYWERPRSELDDQKQISLSSVDVVLVLQSSSEPALERVLVELKQQGQIAGYRIVHRQSLSRTLVDGTLVDAFGLTEGASQPQPQVEIGDRRINESGRSEDPKLVAPIDSVPLGELLLGHRDRHGDVALSAQAEGIPRLFRNSTFMVMRKLEQHVDRFDAYVRESADELGITPDELKRMIVGKVDPPNAPNDNPNDFDFSQPRAQRCPLHAHIRLANPRLGTRDQPRETPRVLRRGFSYNRDEGRNARGIMFMAYCASITSQYETIQRWLNAGNITGLLSWQNDVLTGPLPGAPFPRRMPAAGIRARLQRHHSAIVAAVTAATTLAVAPIDVRAGAIVSWSREALSVFVPALTQAALPIVGAVVAVANNVQQIVRRVGPRPGQAVTPHQQPFVSLRWGVYLFVPSRNSLHWLLNAPEHRDEDADINAGKKLIERLDALASPDEARLEWKRVIEDPAFDEQARQVWAAIRNSDVPKATPYGNLIGRLPAARAVLTNTGAEYSVAKYRERLNNTIGDHYLGLDAHTSAYQQLSAANAIMRDVLNPNEVRVQALHAGRTAIDRLPVLKNLRSLQIEDDFARPVVRILAEQWFGLPLPDPDDPADRYFQYFIDTSRYAFQPHPEPELERALQQQRPQMDLDHYPTEGSIGDALLKSSYLADQNLEMRRAAIRLVLTGGIAGFCAPAIAAIKSVLDKWIESDEIGWLAERVRYGNPDADLTRMLFEALARRPVPPLLYRTDPAGNNFSVVGLSSVYRDAGNAQPEQWFFGGPNEWDGVTRAPHACPARTAAIQVLLGALTAVLEQKNIRRERRALIKFEVG